MEDKKHARIKDAIQSKQYDLAIELLNDESADESETLYLQAVCTGRVGESQKAMALLDRLISLHPKHARGFQERGHLLRALGEDNAALSAYGRATQENGHSTPWGDVNMGPSGLDREIGAVHCRLNSHQGYGVRSLRVGVVDSVGTRCSALDFARLETTVPVLWTADW